MAVVVNPGLDRSEESCRALSSVFSSKSSSLRELDLNNNKLQDSGVKLLSAGLKNPHCTLEKLRMSYCSITDEGCAALASALRSNSSSHLRELDLYNNNPGESGVKLLSDLLKDPLCTLETLHRFWSIVPCQSHFSYFDKTTDMCLKPISVVTSYRRRHSHPRSRGHVSRNLIYPPLLSQSQTVVVGGLWNCQSAIRKADFISALASHYSFDFLALTETWISPQNTATPAALSSAYTFSHSPRESGRGGGTVSVTSPINLFIIVIYRPPGPLGNFLDEMDTLLSVFPSDSTPLTVLGDFNLPSDKLHSSGLLALLNSFSLSFNSCPPTQKGKGNVLDLVFTHPSPATDMTVTPLHISDHHLVSFSITLPVLPKRNPQHLSLTRRNLHSISPSSVASCTLSSLPDHESFSSLPLDSATDTLLSSLSSTMDFLCPLSIIRRKNSSPAPWLSDVLRNNRRELRSAARKWKKSKLDTDLTSYRTLLSKFSLDVTSAKTSFYKEKLETSAQDPRKLHNIFSSLLNPLAPPSPSSLTAEDFASFYTEKIERICQTFTSLPTSPTSHNQHSATPSLTQLSTVAAEEVLQITRSCNPTTCPLDPIPSAMLQTISPDLLPFITTVINGSLTSGHVPTGFKKARVIPILKKPALDPSDISNYRPVSLLSFLSKILERVVCNQLSDYLMQNNLHDPNQSGFKAAHSTETALLAVTEKLHAARSAKLSSVLILLELSAAFDTVNHKTLLSTLRSLGICGTAWEWFASYLDGRSYQVTWKGLTSAPRRLSTGVPQGSVLGPLLFSLYTHSLGKVISSHGFSYHCYADDTQLIFSFPPSDTTASARISACLADISSWMTAHQLKLNPSKTELLIIPGDPSPAQDLAISLSNSMISPTASARNLGVTMDNQLSFSSHVTNVTRSCRFLLYNIRRIRPFLSTQATQVLVQSLVISRLDYCNSLLAGLPLNAIRPLQMIQNAAARLVFNLPKFSHITPLLRSLHWLPVAARIRFKTLMLAYKAKNGPAPSYLKALVTSRTAPRLLRSTSTARLVPPSLREKGRLCDCNLTEESCKVLSSVLTSNSSSLRELNLSENKLQDSGVKLLSAGLKNPHCILEKLRMIKCSITDEGCAALASALRSNSSSHLRELDLYNNNPGESGVKLLSDLLKDPLCTLETL
ncbi:hypothetical protein QTP70_000860, partial [Hemibagrus guttatus]